MDFEEYAQHKTLSSKKSKINTGEDEEKNPKKRRTIEKLMAKPEDVALNLGKGSKGRGAEKGGFFWKVFFKESIAGKVFINLINEPPIGLHPSIQVFLNKSSQGKGIGRIVFAQACLASTYDIVYAHMRKSNIASSKAAQAAGFKEVNIVGDNQRTFCWNRK